MDQKDTTSFQTVVNALLDNDQEFPARYLPYFSDMDPASMESFLQAWPRVKPARKLELLERLESLADKDTLVAFDDLGRALLLDPDASVRTRAIRLLAECEDPKLVRSYIQLLNSDPDASTRAEAATALGQFVMRGELDEIPPSAHREAEDALLKSLNDDKNIEVRRRSLESLGFSSRPELPTLIESAYHREDQEWVASALFAMGRSADDRWDDQVANMLLSDEPAVQLAAVQAAGELGLASAAPILLKLLEDEEDAGQIEAAIWSLSQIGGEDARLYIQSVIDLAEDEEQIEFLE
ncbi:MAG TPA: HEAT repeat domain-containing protein, partial [Anaerolineales bacterium]